MEINNPKLLTPMSYWWIILLIESQDRRNKMLVKLLKSGYSFDENIHGQKVIAGTWCDGYYVTCSELHRVGIIDDDYLLGVYSDDPLYFSGEDVTVIESKLENCTDYNAGKGWEGFYEQAPVIKSKFR
jgi:hypothetical protein